MSFFSNAESEIPLTEGELRVGRMIMDDIRKGKYCTGRTFIGHRAGKSKARALGKEMFRAQIRNTDPETTEPFTIATGNDRRFVGKALAAALPYYEKLPDHPEATTDPEVLASFHEWVNVIRGLSHALTAHE